MMIMMVISITVIVMIIIVPGEGHSALWCAVREQREDMVSILSSALSVLFNVGGYNIIIIEAFQYHNIHSKSLLNFCVPSNPIMQYLIQ